MDSSVDNTRGALAIAAVPGRPAPRRYGRPALVTMLGLVVAANAAVIVWLWLSGGGVKGVHSLGDLSTSIGRVTGLLSAYLALLQVLLLARLPWLERIAGFDRLTVWHRLNGKACLALVLAHVVFITAGYAATDKIALPSEAAQLLSSYTGMVAATVGTVLLIVVVLSSLVVARQRLPYEAWYAVHLTTYAGIALAWVHQIPTGNDLTANAAAAAYWTALYVATLALLVVFRLAAPLAQALRHRLRVAAVTVEGPGVVSLHINGHRLDKLNARAGQFFLWRFLDGGRWWQAHPFSLSAAPDGRTFRLTAKAVGGYTVRLADIAPGTRVVVEGPFGVFTAASRKRTRVALIAGGIGITPLRALVEEMQGDPGDLVLIYRAVNENDLVFRAELDALASQRGLVVHYVVGDHRDPASAALLSPEHLQRLAPDFSAREVYICGPPAIMRLTTENARRAGVPARYIHSESFAL